MKICICGLGSIGKRHIVNLDKILKQRKIEYTIDALRSSPVPLEDEIAKLLDFTYYDWRDLEDDYDIVLITNPTAYHHETIKKLVTKTKHMFIEKPIFDRTDVGFEDFKFRSEGIYYVACPLRYSPVIKYLKDYLIDHHAFSVRSICSSYLPDWRKGKDYRKIYSASKEQGGGVVLDIIHEWDYLIYLFGIPNHIKMFKGTYSNLEINSDDLAVYIAEYSDRLVELHLDYFGRIPQREIFLYTADELVKADILNNTITFCVEDEVLRLNKEDIYLNEMNNYIEMILNNANNINTPLDAFNCLKIALGEF